MDLHSLSPETGGITQTLQEGEAEAPVVPASFADNSAVRIAQRVIALGALTGSLLASGPFVAETVAEDSLATQPVATLSAGPHHATQERHTPSTASHTGREAIRCSQIVPFPKGYYFGKACSDDRMVKLGESKPRGFSYGMLIVNGVYKCGYVQDSIVPIERGPHKSADYCLQVSKQRIFNPHAYLKDLSCDPGDCSGGESTDAAPECAPEVNVYANFATAQRSVFNVYPDHKSGFVGLEGEQSDKISYRATVADSSRAGLAAIVWGINVDWGFTQQECVPEQVLISSHATNDSPPIKLSDALSSTSQLLATPTP